ncbi:MAG TPA: glycoside hydrolase family 16 protein [Planctomycetota bacterium]|nr:glycoside hydrolase family 16 protein [Planctomycetota bacterium]
MNPIARSLIPALVIIAAAAEDGPRLVFADEFDQPGRPDPAKWTYEEGLVRNGEAQFYTRDRAENARVSDGCLVITARKEAFSGAAYTSASLTTQGLADFTYGRIAVRARLPKGRGTWPAIWTLASDITQTGWPLCGEIDIMEHVGFDPLRVHTTVHTAAYNHTKGTQRGHGVEVADLSQEFHVYGCTWDEDAVRFDLDGVETFVFPNDGAGDRATWPFDRPHYLILNLAIGGGWGGQQGIDDAIFPAEMRVDYVRVWQP